MTDRSRMLRLLPSWHELQHCEALHCSRVSPSCPHLSLLQLHQVRTLMQMCRLDPSPEETQQDNPVARAEWTFLCWTEACFLCLHLPLSSGSPTPCGYEMVSFHMFLFCYTALLSLFVQPHHRYAEMCMADQQEESVRWSSNSQKL